MNEQFIPILEEAWERLKKLKEKYYWIYEAYFEWRQEADLSGNETIIEEEHYEKH